MPKIIAGTLKGRVVETLAGNQVRPTGSMAREAIFSILSNFRSIDGEVQNRLHGARVLDLFAGSGIMGFEALSRGAENIHFVDKDRKVIEKVKEYAEKFSVSSDCQFTVVDSLSIRTLKNCYDLVFIDPPYGKDLAGAATKNLIAQQALAHGALLVVETGVKEALNPPPGVKMVMERVYGASKFSFLTIGLFTEAENNETLIYM